MDFFRKLFNIFIINKNLESCEKQVIEVFPISTSITNEVLD